MAKRRSTLPVIRGDEHRVTYTLKSQALLVDQMRYRRFTTGYQLAKASGLLPGTVNHLVFGRRTTCSPETASAIEEALNVRPGTLFRAEVYPVPGYPVSPSTPTRKAS